MVAKYDPAKAHEYYERTKKLKGREKGKRELPTSGGRPKAVQPPPKDRQAARARATARVKALNAKLTQLKAALTAARAKSSSSDKPAAKPTDAEKAKQNEDYYTKNKTKIANDRKAEARSAPSKSGSSKTESTASTPATRSVEELESAIKSTLTDLKSAIAKLKSL